MKELFSDIPNFNKWIIIRQIPEGWSHDKKYYLKTEGGSQFLLRISDAASLEEEKSYYKALSQLNKYNLRVSRLEEEGIC